MHFTVYLYFYGKVLKSDHIYIAGISTKFYSFPMTLSLYILVKQELSPCLVYFEHPNSIT